MDDPALWVKVNDLTRRDASVVAEEFADEISQMSGRCIDIGTGPGDVLVDFLLPKMNPDATVVGFDISEGMINYAKDKYKNNRRLSFGRLDIETPDLPEDLVGKFDHAMSFYCLHWCLDQRQAMENIFNMLRPGGTVMLTSLAKFPWLKAYEDLAAMPRYRPFHEGNRYTQVFLHLERTHKTMKRLAEDAGFEVRHCSVRDRIYTFESADTYRHYLTVAAGPFIRKMPADIRDDYIKDLIEQATKYNLVLNKNDNQGKPRIVFIYSSFAVYLKKPSAE